MTWPARLTLVMCQYDSEKAGDLPRAPQTLTTGGPLQLSSHQPPAAAARAYDSETHTGSETPTKRNRAAALNRAALRRRWLPVGLPVDVRIARREAEAQPQDSAEADSDESMLAA